MGRKRELKGLSPEINLEKADAVKRAEGNINADVMVRPRWLLRGRRPWHVGH